MNNFRPIELRLINRVATQYTGGLRLLALLITTDSKQEHRLLFERVEKCVRRMGRMVWEFRTLYPRAAPADKILGSARFKGVLEYVKEGGLGEFAYSLALVESVLANNFIGPVPPDEEKALKLSNSPLVRDLSGVPYRLFSPEKPVSRFFAQQFQTIASRLRKEREREERELLRRTDAIRSSVSRRDLLISLKGMFAVNLKPKGETSSRYLELEGNGFEIKVVWAESFSESLIGRSFGRGKLPIEIYRELRGERKHKFHQNRRFSARRNVLRFIPGEVKAA